MTERQRDEMHLAWMRARDEGISSYQTAARWGVRPEAVRTVLNRVSRDLEKSEGWE